MMNKRIRSMIDEIFSEMKMTADNLALRDELMANALDRYEDSIAQGMSEEKAFAEVAQSLDDVQGLLEEMNRMDAQPKEEPEEEAVPELKTGTEAKADEAEAAAAQQTDLGDALNKAFGALGDFTQTLMPEAKKLVRQMDDATGGMLRGLGKAAKKGLMDAQKAAEEAIDKLDKGALVFDFGPKAKPEAEEKQEAAPESSPETEAGSEPETVIETEIKTETEIESEIDMKPEIKTETEIESEAPAQEPVSEAAQEPAELVFDFPQEEEKREDAVSEAAQGELILDLPQQEPEKVAEENLVMGCPMVGLSWCSEHKLEDLEDVRTYIGQVQKIGRVMRENGLTFAIHNHWMEFHRYDGKTVFQMLKEQVDPAELSFILCCYWAIEAGADPVEYLHEFAGRVPVCHYKDRTMLKSERTFAPVGQGNMNYKAIFKACEETGVQHAMIEQDICRKDPFECMAESRAHILSLGEAYDKGAL